MRHRLLATAISIEIMIAKKSMLRIYLCRRSYTQDMVTLDGILFTSGEDKSYLNREVITSEVHLYRVLS